MKKLLVTISIFTVLLNINAQNVDDAVRYSQIFYTGTARFNSMGSAFTSLGADLSAVSLNPAGAGMFRRYEISVTPMLVYNNTSADFNNTTSTDFRYTFGLSQAGVVANTISKEKTTGLISFNVGYTYTGTNNFNENTVISGMSDNSSMGDYWARISEGIYYQDLKGSAGLAYDAWVMDTITGSGARSYGTVFSSYGDNANSTYGQTISRMIMNEGYTGEHAFFFGGNLSERFFFGGLFGINPLKYTGHYEHTEADYDNTIPDFKNFVYTDHFEATGTGYSVKLGATFRLLKILRVGAAFHSPIIYRIDEYFYDNISSEFDNFDQFSATNEPLRYTYTLTTPYRILTGASIQLGKLGIITADYEFVDYTKARFSKASDGYNYSNENSSIQNSLKVSNNIRLGAELRINPIYLRAGCGLYGSAFKAGEVNEDFYSATVSGGLGFRHENFYFDLAYVARLADENYFMYDDPPYLQPAKINYARNTFSATIGLKF